MFSACSVRFQLAFQQRRRQRKVEGLVTLAWGLAIGPGSTSVAFDCQIDGVQHVEMPWIVGRQAGRIERARQSEHARGAFIVGLSRVATQTVGGAQKA